MKKNRGKKYSFHDSSGNREARFFLIIWRLSSLADGADDYDMIAEKQGLTNKYS